MKEKYLTQWEETLWTAYDYNKPVVQTRGPKMKKYVIAAVGMVAVAALAQTPKIHANDVEQYQTAEPVDIIVTAKRPVAKKDAAPRKSKASSNKNSVTPTKTSTK